MLQDKAKALTAEYTSAQSHLQQLTASGAPKSGFTLLQAASPGQAKLIPAASSLLVHRPVRAGIGFLAGLLLGAALAMLRDGFDRRLRQAARTSAVFGLPVIAEIPRRRGGSGGSRMRPRGAGPPNRSRRRGKKGAVVLQPVAATSQISVVDTPASIVAEAYRRLRVSVMLAPALRPQSGGDPAKEAYEQANGLRPLGSNGGISERSGSSRSVRSGGCS